VANITEEATQENHASTFASMFCSTTSSFSNKICRCPHVWGRF